MMDRNKWMMVISFGLLTVFFMIAETTMKTEQVSDKQLAEERAMAVQVASEIRVPHGVFLVSKQEIIWLTQWNVGNLATIRASLEDGVGVPMSGIIFSFGDERYNRPISTMRSGDGQYNRPLGVVRANMLARVTDVVHPSDCNYMKVLTGINNRVYAYPEGLPECE